ncbi:hypothetical protein NDU88_007577 [Pleurodeles waltl]|uniref:Uncharacterized protein n=1 Tax=Pleurodeles waltl TaxID=8319 RepID=A0AAV7U1M7_PLEWA|nr:hypothetical protein NDU88_007577 [Pleurodeles waltl]
MLRPICNRAVIATATIQAPEPSEGYPGGMRQDDNNLEVIPNPDIRVEAASAQEDEGTTGREEARNSREPEERKDAPPFPEDEEDDSKTQLQKDLKTETPTPPDEIQEGRGYHRYDCASVLTFFQGRSGGEKGFAGEGLGGKGFAENQ